ncbi:MAG: micrococcal nuclease [Desulforhopalus sp.]|jgi:micrococcal nuclease
MKRPFVVLTLFLFVSACLLFYSDIVFAKKPFTAQVTKIIDGDSLKVRAGKKVYEIRLYGIDAPEYDQPYSSKAKKLVKQTMLGKRVTVIPVEWDKYQRLVAIVSYNNEAINERLLRRGLAWYYPKYCKMSVCRSWKKTGKTARKNKQNIWSDSSSVAPWKWRYNKHKRK